MDAIDTFLMDRIHAAQEYIIGKGQTSIRDKDVILVFAKSGGVGIFVGMLLVSTQKGDSFSSCWQACLWIVSPLPDPIL